MVAINDSLSKQSKIIIEGLYDEINSTEMASFISDYIVNDESSSKVKISYVESAKYELDADLTKK